jgi:hypothetical protein
MAKVGKNAVPADKYAAAMVAAILQRKLPRWVLENIYACGAGWCTPSEHVCSDYMLAQSSVFRTWLSGPAVRLITSSRKYMHSMQLFLETPGWEQTHHGAA